MSKQKMSFRDAMDLVPDDLPDGAFFAMAHEMAGLDYGDGFDDAPEVPMEPSAADDDGWPGPETAPA